MRLLAYAGIGTAGLVASLLLSLPAPAASPTAIRMMPTAAVKKAVRLAYATRHGIEPTRVPRFVGRFDYARFDGRTWALVGFRGRAGRELFTRPLGAKRFSDLGSARSCAPPTAVVRLFGLTACTGKLSSTAPTTAT